jgi:hypothetical protein
MALTDEKPVKRFKVLVDILLERPTLPAHEKRLKVFQNTPVEKIIEHFKNKLIPY